MEKYIYKTITILLSPDIRINAPNGSVGITFFYLCLRCRRSFMPTFFSICIEPKMTIEES